MVVIGRTASRNCYSLCSAGSDHEVPAYGMRRHGPGQREIVRGAALYERDYEYTACVGSSTPAVLRTARHDAKETVTAEGGAQSHVQMRAVYRA